jgi:hypothetical protein
MRKLTLREVLVKSFINFELVRFLFNKLALKGVNSFSVPDRKQSYSYLTSQITFRKKDCLCVIPYMGAGEIMFLCSWILIETSVGEYSESVAMRSLCFRF